MIGPQCEPAVLVGIQKTAKRPETNKGGREEEEKRLGISAGPQGPDRLRSAKRNTDIGDGAELWAERKDDAEKFQPIVIGVGFRVGSLAAMVVGMVKIYCLVLL
jgi:hypothetical protein